MIDPQDHHPQQASQRPSATTAQTAGLVPATPAVVTPSPLVRVTMGPMTRVLNPLIKKLAGRRHFMMAAQIRHVGRRSGRSYVTPASASRIGDLIVIPLTFGNSSDWSRNVRAAGGCTIRLNGVDYEAIRPQLVDRGDARDIVRQAYGPFQRAAFRMLGIRQVMVLRLAGHPVT
jgi:deazaflavin-dependent oxidoreductase (nitroreductase family)